MKQGESEKLECYVLFTKTTLKHCIFRFIDSELQHVYVMMLSPGGQFWTIIDPVKSHIKIDTATIDEYPTPRDYDNDAVVLPVNIMINKNRNIYGFGLFYCVTVVKALLGVKKRSIMTPFQLYKYLKEV